MPSEVDIGGSGIGGGGKSKGKIEKSIEDGCCVECVGGGLRVMKKMMKMKMKVKGECH